MKKLFNDGWSFVKTDVNCSYEEVEKLQKQRIEIPHDWLIHQTKALYETSCGWYTKNFEITNIGNTYKLCFDGVYMNTTIYINGKEVFCWKYGYSSFEVDISANVIVGNNNVTVKVCHQSPNSRWYSGAGIYRNVYFVEHNSAYIKTDSIYFSAKRLDDKLWQVKLSAETDKTDNSFMLKYTLKDKNNNTYTEKTEYCNKEAEFTVNEPQIWDIKAPEFYTLEAELIKDGQVFDCDKCRVGFRSIEFRPDSGFYLNGKNVKIHGVCMHHDLGCLGAAVNKAALRRQLEIMQKMGANAVRTSHNMPARELLELCTEMGILVDNEAFDIWELKKNEYDYARFFDEWYKKDVESWIKRDRSCPAVIMWSIGNEIYDTHVSSRGLEVTEMLCEEVRKYDYNRNAFTTIGSNYVEWENAQKCSDKVDISGYNYGEYLYEKHHAKYPHWCIYGSETGSRVQSRGIYHFPLSAAYITHEDLQCSELGNCRSGATDRTSETSVIADRDTTFCAGQFIWTGFDYIGEPSPYSTKNSYFGQADTAGFVKDSYYLYKAAWTNEAVTHIMPYWDFNGGQLIDVVVYSNAYEVELLYNEKSLGRKKSGKGYTFSWQLPYQNGCLTAIGFDASGNETSRDKTSSFGNTASLEIKPDKTKINANGTDLIFAEISALDYNGRFVANARDRINVTVEGAGRLVGLDSGDSTDYDEYKCSSKRLFNGKLLAVIAASYDIGKIIIRAEANGVTSTVAEAYSESCEKVVGTSDYLENNEQCSISAEIPVRKIIITASTNKLCEKGAEAEIHAEIQPENATYRELEWSAVTNSGIKTNIAEIIGENNVIKLRAVGDGSFRLRCTAANGKPQPEVISELEFEISGAGRAVCNPYEFTPASLYSACTNPPDEVTQGGVSVGVEERNFVGYKNYDFGKDGSDKLTVKIINWHKNNEVYFSVWKGIYGTDKAEKLGDYTYQADFVWQTYIENSFDLPQKLIGINDISFVFDATRSQRISFGGFVFAKENMAYNKIFAADNDNIFGGGYSVSGKSINHIGNNVYIDFAELSLDNDAKSITVCGKTYNSNDSVHLRINGTEKYILEFPFSENAVEKTFEINKISGKTDLRFEFLPGCDFNLEWFKFNA